MRRFSALLGLPACPSPGHLASARFLESAASVRMSPHYSSPPLLSGSGLTFSAWASSYSISCQMPWMYLLLALLPLAHSESSVTSHYHTVASYPYESSSNSGAPPCEYPKVNTFFCSEYSFLQLTGYIGCVCFLHRTRILDGLHAESKRTIFNVDQVLALCWELC